MYLKMITIRNKRKSIIRWISLSRGSSVFSSIFPSFCLSINISRCCTEGLIFIHTCYKELQGCREKLVRKLKPNLRITGITGITLIFSFVHYNRTFLNFTYVGGGEGQGVIRFRNIRSYA